MKHWEFQTTAHAKCILAGEHAVIRGYPALVTPIRAKTITLSYAQFPTALTVDFASPYGEVLLTLFWDTLKNGLKMLKKNMDEMTGNFFIENSIPIGAGIGFSSALCVVISRWFIWQGWVKESQLFNFARKLEHAYHSTSSGVDIAGAMAKQCIRFKQDGTIQEIPSTWQPNFYLSSSQSVKNTANAVNSVKYLTKKDPKLVQATDQAMEKSTLLIEQALQMEKSAGLALLKSAIEIANNCFNQWGLITTEMRAHMQTLAALGAIASKPTGAGGGGYLLSLWADKPPANITIKLLSVF